MKNFLLSLFVNFILFSSVAEAYDLYKKMRSQEEVLSLKLGNSLYKENKLSHALLIFHDFIELYPGSSRRSQVLEKIAVIYEERQEYVLAKRMYMQLFEELGLSTKGLNYYLEVARLSEMMGDIKKAHEIYQMIIKNLPGSEIAIKAKKRIQLNKLFIP